MEQQTELQTIGKLLFISTIAASVGGFFLSQAYSIIFTLLFAFSGTLMHLTEKVNPTVYDIRMMNDERSDQKKPREDGGEKLPFNLDD
jgi:hypothetical protein